MTASLGQFSLLSIKWSGPHALTCVLATAFTDKIFQMYCGRHLVGVTHDVGDLILTGQVSPTKCPAPITIVMAELDERDTDIGDQLPPRPWNQYRIGWDASSFPDDTAWFATHQSTAPGGAVDYSAPILKTPFAGDGTYSQELPDLAQCGVWTYGIVPRDNASGLGNAGTAAELSIEVLVFPPDVAVDELGQRLAVSVGGGITTVDFSYDW